MIVKIKFLREELSEYLRLNPEEKTRIHERIKEISKRVSTYEHLSPGDDFYCGVHMLKKAINKDFDECLFYTLEKITEVGNPKVKLVSYIVMPFICM
jgi:hypothetical protein